MLIEGKVKGIKNNTQEVELTYRIQKAKDDHRHILSLVEGGVTGYESFYIDDLIDDPVRDKFYWCIGGMGYPSLSSDIEDIKAIVQAFLKLKEIGE